MKGFSFLLAAALWLVPLQQASAATTSIDVRVADDGEVSIVATAVIAADLRTAWRVLTDYERYPEFIPGVRESRVVTREGDTTRVEQSVDAPVWALGSPLAVTYEITESSPGHLHSRGTARGSLLDSAYRLTPTDDGVRIDYTGRLSVPPGWLAPLSRRTGQRMLSQDFQALADEIELRGRSDGR
jgi:carbon monoxide dehydrogenase subunit G